MGGTIFTINRDIEEARAFRGDVRAQMAQQGRAPDGCRTLTAVMPFIGRTKAEAIARRDEHNALARPELGIATMSGQRNFDFGDYDGPRWSRSSPRIRRCPMPCGKRPRSAVQARH